MSTTGHTDRGGCNLCDNLGTRVDDAGGPECDAIVARSPVTSADGSHIPVSRTRWARMRLCSCSDSWARGRGIMFSAGTSSSRAPCAATAAARSGKRASAQMFDAELYVVYVKDWVGRTRSERGFASSEAGFAVHTRELAADHEDRRDEKPRPVTFDHAEDQRLRNAGQPGQHRPEPG
jgi:hypothetical protein